MYEIYRNEVLGSGQFGIVYGGTYVDYFYRFSYGKG